MSKKTILVTGANGQLGSELQGIAKQYTGYDFLFTTREQLPLDDNEALEQFFKEHTIDVCINCGAYTAVDKAETETDKAFSINGEAVGKMASFCKEQNALFIHISTDYVFDGNATEPYKEDHTVDPVNAYGASKLKGEEAAMSNNASSIIIRTSWVYSSFGNNFVKTMLRLMKDRPSLNVVADQQGCPTYAADLAIAILKIVEQAIEDNKSFAGIYHYSNEGVITWYDFAVAIKELSGSTCVVNPIPTSQYPTSAKRPGYSVMDTSKIKSTFDLAIPKWKDSLQKCMQLL